MTLLYAFLLLCAGATLGFIGAALMFAARGDDRSEK